MKVSVLIPTYNRRNYIAQAIDSVLEQDYPDLEIIVVDDGSTDGTEALIKQMYPSIRYTKTENQGPAEARNTAMAAATGAYITYLDSDDVYFSYKTRIQAALLNANPQLGMVFSNFSAFDDEGYLDKMHLATYHRSAYRDPANAFDRIFSKVESCAATIKQVLRHDEDLSEYDLRLYRGNIYLAYLFNTLVFTNSMMFRREVMQKVGFQHTRFGMFHDLEFALRMSRETEVGFLNVPTYKLRYHRGQISTLNRDDGELTGLKIQRDLLKVFLHHCRADPALCRSNREKIDRHLARLIRAIAVPLLSYDGDNHHKRECYPRRARKYLACCKRLGAPNRRLYLLSYLPGLLRRIGFRLLAV